VRHGGGKGGFKRRELAQRHDSPRGRVGSGATANFYGEAAAPGARAAPRGRGEGGGGNGCPGVDEREMGQKKRTERQPTAFQAAWWRGAEREKGEGGPTCATTWRGRTREEGAWCCGRQRRAASNGPRSSGVGDSVAVQTW
jgi:hypothetical protein